MQRDSLQNPASLTQKPDIRRLWAEGTLKGVPKGTLLGALKEPLKEPLTPYRNLLKEPLNGALKEPLKEPFRLTGGKNGVSKPARR